MMSNNEDIARQTEHSWKTHAYLNEYIKFADAKAGILIAIVAAMLIFTLQTKKFHDPAALPWFAYIGVGLLSLSFASGVLVISPVLFTKETISHPVNSLLQFMNLLPTARGTIFWNSIRAYNSSDEFVGDLRAKDESALLTEVANHTFELSAVLQNKFGWLKYSLCLGIIGIGFVASFFAMNGLDITLLSAN